MHRGREAEEKGRCKEIGRATCKQKEKGKERGYCRRYKHRGETKVKGEKACMAKGYIHRDKGHGKRDMYLAISSPGTQVDALLSRCDKSCYPLTYACLACLYSPLTCSAEAIFHVRAQKRRHTHPALRKPARHKTTKITGSTDQNYRSRRWDLLFILSLRGKQCQKN